MSITTKYEGKWLNFCEASFTNAHGQTGNWEFAARSGTNQATCIVARVGPSAENIVLVKQWRPPVGNAVLEFPAGLVDVGEQVEQAALRELEEETGYLGQVVSMSPPIYSSPGLTNENVVMVEIQVSGKTGQKLEADEDLEVLEVPIQSLKDYLLSSAKDGIAIDAKLWSFAQGLSKS